MKWSIDGRYTVIGISEVLALTTKTEIRVAKIDDAGEPVIALRRKRTLHKFRDGLGRDKLVFEGWDIPLKVDSEQEGSFVMNGNACFNFLGDAEGIRSFVSEKNLNEYFSRHDAILAHGERVRPGGDSAIPVYPEVPTTHAVIKQIREKLGMSQAPEVVFSYSRDEAIADDVIRPNPSRDAFHECDMITSNLSAKLKELAAERNKDRAQPLDEADLLGCLMAAAKAIYEGGTFTGDQDRDFFVVDSEGVTVWFVRNEAARLTAMLPEDY